MRGLAIIALPLVLAACSGEPAAPDAATEAESADFAMANGAPAGTYEVSAADGTTSIVTVNPDGTYSQVMPDGSNPAAGTLEIVDGKTCFKVHSVGAEPLCYTESELAEDGSYTAIPDGGEPLTVKPVASEPEGETPPA